MVHLVAYVYPSSWGTTLWFTSIYHTANGTPGLIFRPDRARGDLASLLHRKLDAGQSGCVEDIETHYQAALSLDPGDALNTRNYGLFVLSWGGGVREKEAEQLLRRADAMSPGIVML